MESGANAPQVLADLWASILKIIGRPAIQQQLLVTLIAVGLAWGVTRWITHQMRRRESVQEAALREQVLAEARNRLDELERQEEDAREAAPSSAADALAASEERLYYATLLQDDAALAEALVERYGSGSRMRSLIQQVLFPLLAILLLYAGYVFAVAEGWYSGLLVDLIVLFALYFLYRLALGIAYAFGDDARVAYYQYRLFGPLVAVLVILLALNVVGDLSALAGARVMPLAAGWLTIGMIFIITFGFYLWIMLLSLIKDLIKAVAVRRSAVNIGSLDAVLTLIQYGFVALGLFGVLRMLQVNAATIAAISGGLSIGVGFALQDVLKNFFGGIIVLFEGSVRPGDWVEIAGTEGAIDKLSIRSTTVRTFDNVEYIVPNQDWLNSTVKTFTRSSRLVRTQVPIGVTYAADPHFVRELLTETVAQHPDVLPEPAPVAPLINFGASSLDFLVLAWVSDATIKGKVASELRLQIWDALKANDIEIPFPQQDIHIRSGLHPLLANSSDAVAPSASQIDGPVQGITREEQA
jgi:small-conductance mechanosensitive channel